MFLMADVGRPCGVLRSGARLGQTGGREAAKGDQHQLGKLTFMKGPAIQ